MKKIITAICLVAVMALALPGCTDNQRARALGGTATKKLPPNMKLVNVTWKNADMWVLYRPMYPGEKAETYSFQEESNWGVLEGTVNIVETKN